MLFIIFPIFSHHFCPNIFKLFHVFLFYFSNVNMLTKLTKLYFSDFYSRLTRSTENALRKVLNAFPPNFFSLNYFKYTHQWDRNRFRDRLRLLGYLHAAVHSIWLSEMAKKSNFFWKFRTWPKQGYSDQLKSSTNALSIFRWCGKDLRKLCGFFWGLGSLHCWGVKIFVSLYIKTWRQICLQNFGYPHKS